MKRSRTGSFAGKAPAASAVATVQVPVPLLAVLADVKTAFFGLCLTAGQQVFQTLMEEDRAQLCGPKNVPNPDRHAYRGGSAPSEVVLGGAPHRAAPLARPECDGRGAPAAQLRIRQR